MLSDHGEMVGERGMWFKRTFYEWAMRVPLLVYAPLRFTSRRARQNVSLVDLLPTLVEFAGGEISSIVPLIDGRSIVPLLGRDDSTWPDVVYAEQLDHGTMVPRMMIRQGRYKYVFDRAFPSQLFDLTADPHERRNVAGAPEHEHVEQTLRSLIEERWNYQDLCDRITGSQRRRRFVQRALRQGHYRSWEYQPVTDAATRFVRAGDTFPDVDERNFYRHEVPWGLFESN